MSRKSLFALAAAGALMTLAPMAQAQYTTIVRVEPPAPLTEVVPAHREGFVWAPGHHEWRNGQYVWMRGHWIPERRGYVYREPRWIQRGNGDWYMVGGNWERGPYGDRDHDGIANRYDRDDRYARRGQYGDRDRDGVPNYRDRQPDNPYRN